MSQIWTFSPSSKPLLQRCLEAAARQETDNEWIRHFGRRNTAAPKSNISAEKYTTEIIEVPLSPVKKEEPDVTVTYDDFFENLKNEIRLEFIVTECAKNKDLLPKMAQRLSVNTVENLFNHVFASTDIENSFLTDLYFKFFPLYIKLQYSWLCIDLLTRAHKKHPEIFKKLLIILFEDTEIPNQVLNNYVSSLQENEVTIFMENLSTIEMSSKIFLHNILTIFNAYKDCQKTNNVQNYIKDCLLQHSKNCASERNYGRLFLAYLQAEKMLEHKISKQLVECLTIHHSPFKRPCEILIKELVQ